MTSTRSALAWLALSLAGWVAAFAMAFFVVAGLRTVGVVSEDPFGVRADLGVLLGLHGALAIGTVQVTAWLALGTWPTMTLRGAVIPTIGVVLAIGVELALHEWAEARYGYYDVEFIGVTALLSIALVATATSLFGVLIAPRGAVASPFGALVVAGAGVIFAVISNLGDLGDGIGPGAWPLAVLVGSSAAYVAVALLVGTRRVRSG